MKSVDVDEKYLIGFSRTIVYLWNDEYQCYVRSVPGQGYFAKFPGQQEYALGEGSDIATMAVLGGQTVTKKQYYNS